jgi:hypothetical protein
MVGHIRVTEIDGCSNEAGLNVVELLRRMAPDGDWSVASVVFTDEVNVCLKPIEVRQYLFEAPTRVTQRDPAIEVSRRAPHGETPVCR